MATFVLRRSDVFPVGTVVGAYPVAMPPVGFAGPPGGAAAESQTVAADGTATFTTLASDTPYVFAAQVSGTWVRVRGRVSTGDAARGRAVGTGDTTSGSAALANVAATTGSFQIGQRITGPGIPPGTFLTSGSGASWTMTDKATATALGVALEGHGANTWRARVRRGRAALGTS